MTARLASDIGGTFTDVVLEVDSAVGTSEPAAQFTAKVLTTPQAPADAVLEGVELVLAASGIDAGEIQVVVHGTTLATNALIERRGARTALLCTEGFRDSVAMAHENRFEQYDIFMERPDPLVSRYLRLGVTERISAEGDVLIPLDTASVRALIPTLVKNEIESVAIGFLHSYVDPRHEIEVRSILLDEMPHLSVTLSSEVCPEIREYERLSTACANAYVQPLMATYLTDLADQLDKLGIAAPLMLMLSNGGLCTLDTAVRWPIGLVESGPAGGALLAARVAAEHAVDELLSFDMGGTTAKLCLLTDGQPATSREFEVARVYRFLKGSGLPLRIPVIDLVEIGAGGGSIVSVDQMGRISVGPESAGSEPGPACYARGGAEPTITDADVLAGRIQADWFAGGKLPLDEVGARDAVADGVAGPLGIEIDAAVVGIAEMVVENMANAARVHAVDRGRDLGGGAMVAFGGAAPLHACRLAERLGIEKVIVPPGAGVGSAIGFLRAPVSYELVRTCHQRLDRFDSEPVNRVLDELLAEANLVVGEAAPSAPRTATVYASMRYRGQGHEIEVELPMTRFSDGDEVALLDAFDRAYRSLYTRVIPGMVAEVLTWRVRVSTVVPAPEPIIDPEPNPSQTLRFERVLDPDDGWLDFAIFARSDLQPGDCFRGPALVVEDQTTTVISPRFTARIDGRHHLVLTSNPVADNTAQPAPGGA